MTMDEWARDLARRSVFTTNGILQLLSMVGDRQMVEEIVKVAGQSSWPPPAQAAGAMVAIVMAERAAGRVRLSSSRVFDVQQ